MNAPAGIMLNASQVEHLINQNLDLANIALETPSIARTSVTHLILTVITRVTAELATMKKSAIVVMVKTEGATMPVVLVVFTNKFRTIS